MGRPSTKESLPPVWVLCASRPTAPEVRSRNCRNKTRRTRRNRKRATTATTHYDQIQTWYNFGTLICPSTLCHMEVMRCDAQALKLSEGKPRPTTAA